MVVQRIGKIRNEEIRASLARAGVANISEKIREAKLRLFPMWTERLQKRVMKTWMMEVGGPRQLGKPKLRWSDDKRKYMKDKQVKIEETQDRRTLILKTRCADPKYRKGRRR